MKIAYLILIPFLILNGCQLGKKKLISKQLKKNNNRFIAQVNKNENLQNDIDTVLSKIPRNLRSKLEEYINMIGVFGYEDPKYIGRDNEGLRNFNEVLLEENSCLSKLSKKFYNQIPKIDNSFENNFLRSDYSINYLSESPGWLLNYAMDFTNSNSDLAVTLIGICGHDNAVGTINNGGNTYSCPLNMYVPKALGEKYSISKKLKDKIANIQAPTMGHKAIPAKSYHINSSFYLTCSLIRNGVPSLMAKKIQNRLIYTYRIKRLCEKKLYGDYSFKLNSIGKKIKSLPMQKRRSFIYNKINKCKSNIFTAECNEVVSLIGENTLLSNNEEKVSKAISSFLNSYFVYTLIEKELDNELLCSNIHFTNSIYNQLKKISKKKSSCGDLDESSCNIAKEKIKTWAVDIEWSVEQHHLGSDLASRFCTPGVKFSDIEKASCELN